MTTVNGIFEAFGGPAQVGRIIGVPTEHAASMRRRGSIPVAYWPNLLAGARMRGLFSLTPEYIMSAHALKQQCRRGQKTPRLNPELEATSC